MCVCVRGEVLSGSQDTACLEIMTWEHARTGPDRTCSVVSVCVLEVHLSWKEWACVCWNVCRLRAALQAVILTVSAVPLDNCADSIDLFYLPHNLQAHRKDCFASCWAIIVEVWLNDRFLLCVITNSFIKTNSKDTCLETVLILAFFHTFSKTLVLCQMDAGAFLNNLNRRPVAYIRAITYIFTPTGIVLFTISMSCTSMSCSGNLEHPEETLANTERTSTQIRLKPKTFVYPLSHYDS